jgi:hypothetical protein
MSQSPTFLIVLGPTGSGKSVLPMKVSKYLGMSKIFNNKKTVKILIDDLVEQSPYYKQFVLKDIASYKTKAERNRSFINPSPQKLKAYDKAYFTARSGKPCKINVHDTCNQFNDKLLEEGLKKGANIVFESTGCFFPEWIFKYYLEALNKKKYNVIFAWGAVDLCELLERNKLRALKSVLEFMKNQAKPAPRLPDITRKKYVGLLKEIIETFYKAIEEGGYIKQTAGVLRKPPRVLVFDNRNRDINVLFDSSHPELSGEKTAKSAMNIYNVGIKQCHSHEK